MVNLIEELKSIVSCESSNSLAEVNTLNVSKDTAQKWLQIFQLSLVSNFVDRRKFDLALRLCSSIYVRIMIITVNFVSKFTLSTTAERKCFEWQGKIYFGIKNWSNILTGLESPLIY